MQIDELVEKTASEPERAVVRPVNAPAAVLAAAGRSAGGMRMTDFLAAARTQPEQREVHYRHILGVGASQAAIAAWENRHPQYPLPADLRHLIEQANGIHLWANVETGRSYTGLAPIEEWESARSKMFGLGADPSLLDDRFLAVSYHEDGASYLVLDVVSATYFLMDAAGPDTTSPVAKDISSLLDWLWQARIAP